MKIHKIKTYSYNELSPDAKDVAREEYYGKCTFHDLAAEEQTIYDAANVGLHITWLAEQECRGIFANGAEKTARLIIANHGKSCETWKTAKKFQDEIAGIPCNYDDDFTGELQQKLYEAIREFRLSLCEDFRILYRQNLEYQSSIEFIEEEICCNDYEFTSDGKFFSNS